MSEKIEPIVLVNKEHAVAMVEGHEDDALAYACGKCGIVFAQEDIARGHCLPKVCACGAECKQHYSVCTACSDKKVRDRQQAAVDKAEKVSYVDYDAPVFVEDDMGRSVGRRDGFFMTVDEAIAYLAEEAAGDLPGKILVWGSVRVPFDMSAEDFVESALDDHHEDACDDVADAAIKELQVVLDKWCADVDVVSFVPAYGILVTGVEEEVVSSRKAGELEEGGKMGEFMNYLNEDKNT